MINNDNESFREEGIRLFKLYCKDVGIKADKETYLEYKKEARINGYANLVEYLEYLRSAEKAKNKKKKFGASWSKSRQVFFSLMIIGPTPLIGKIIANIAMSKPIIDVTIWFYIAIGITLSVIGAIGFFIEWRKELK